MSSADGTGRARTSGFTLILAATAIGGISGYVITWLVPRAIGFENYAPFAIYWAFLFLVISALSGIQQEVTRATRVAAQGEAQAHRAVRVAAFVGAGVLVALLGTSLLWSAAVFPDSSMLALPLSIGCACYVAVAVLYGTLYGTQEWFSLFVLVAAEALLRLVLVAAALLLGGDLLALAWAVAIPIPLALVVSWPIVRRSGARRSVMDVGYRALTWNVARTVTATTSMGVLISGLPLVLGLTSGDVPVAQLGLMISAVTLVRAPLIVVAMALQSYFIVRFRAAERVLPMLTRLILAVLGMALVLAAAGYLLGPAVFAALFPGEPVPSSALVGMLVASSALVAMLCLSAPAVLSRSQHFAYSAGWLIAALATILCLVLPLDFELRTLLALFVGPVAGLCVHVTALLRRRPRTH